MKTRAETSPADIGISFETLQEDLLARTARKGQRAPGRARIDNIITACIELLREHRPADISIAMVAEKAGIKRTSVYSHFSKVEEIYEQISVRFVRQTGVFVEDYVRRNNPRTLEELIVLVIRGIQAYFNEPDADSPDSLAQHIPFEMRHVIEDFDKVAALPYHTLWHNEWDIEPLSDADPFRTLVVLQSALFDMSISRYGQITDECVEKAIGVALDFIRRVDAQLSPSSGRKASGAVDRIERAAGRLLAKGEMALLEASALQIEALLDAADRSRSAIRSSRDLANREAE